MTRDQQKKLRELKRALPKIIQTEIKKYKLKKKDFMVWGAKEKLFFDMMIDVRERDGHCYCASVERLKPLWIDDLLWDLLGMPENKNEAVSLRSIGAFTVYGSKIHEMETELVNWEIEELEKCVIAYVEHFYRDIQSFGIDSFYECMDVTPYHQELRKALSLVHKREYQEAFNYLQECGRGVFCNKGVWINEAIIDHCKSKLFQ